MEENKKLPTEQESAVNFAKWKDDINRNFLFAEPPEPPTLNDPPRRVEWIEKDTKGNITSREFFGGSRYIAGCDPYNKDPDDIEAEVFYLTGSQVIARFEEHLTDEQKETIAAHSQRYKKMSNR